MEPMIIINFKTYASGTGKEGLELAKLCKKVNSKIIVAAQATDIAAISKLGVPVFAQHIGSAPQGKFTGHITAEAVAQAGAIGTLINHAEKKMPVDSISQAVTRAKENKLLTIVCAASINEAREIALNCDPDYIAVEPPGLIGGKVSVANAKPEIITKTIEQVHKIKNVPIICGAGIQNSEDVKTAMKLGASGVLVANCIMGAKDKEEALHQLVDGVI